jgi:ribosome biogenesis GTPase / thiamine phosphate phosphatase
VLVKSGAFQGSGAHDGVNPGGSTGVGVGTRRGMLVEVQRRTATVRDDDGRETLCAYSPGIRLGEFSNFAVGDQVEYYPGDAAQEPLITAILPRTSKISRPGPGERHARELILAANVDLLVVTVAAAQPTFNPRLLDRYLAVAERFGIEALICLNKCDLQPVTPPEVLYLHGVGYDYVSVSALDETGLEALREKLRGRLAVLSGPSGAGKSSLIATLVPDSDPRIGEVRESDGKGRHTTTTSHLYATADGVRIIDTPGLRELGLWNVTGTEVAGFWRDFQPYLGQCRFTDCAHRTEPGCAVRAAVDAGKVPDFRLQSYYRVLETLTGDE